jgi:YVTN family beta-propeller protein
MKLKSRTISHSRSSCSKNIFKSKVVSLFLTFLFASSFLYASPQNAQANNGGDLYYLSSTGYLIRLDIKKVTETGQVAAGLMPWGATSCGGHIYFTDFALDQVFDFYPSEKSLNKIKIDPKDIAYKEVDLVSKEEAKKNKSMLVSAFSKVHKAKIKPPTYDATSEPLPIADHNRKIGLASIACNLDYLFVASTLKDRIEVLSRKDLSRVASILVGERPSGLAVSEDGSTLAISSTGANKVYLINSLSGDFAKQAEITVGTGPTEIAWVGNEKVFVLNRGSNNVSVINTANAESASTISFDFPINSIASSKEKNKVYVLAGIDKKLFLVNPDDLTFKDYPISDALKFPDLLNVIGDKDGELLIGSEADGRFIVFDIDKLEFTQKIQTNLPPKAIVTLIDENSKDESKSAYSPEQKGIISKQSNTSLSSEEPSNKTNVQNAKIEQSNSVENYSSVYDTKFDSEINTQAALKNSTNYSTTTNLNTELNTELNSGSNADLSSQSNSTVNSKLNSNLSTEFNNSQSSADFLSDSPPTTVYETNFSTADKSLSDSKASTLSSSKANPNSNLNSNSVSSSLTNSAEKPTTEKNNEKGKETGLKSSYKRFFQKIKNRDEVKN